MGLSLMCVLFKKKKINFNFSSEIDDLSTQQRKENKKRNYNTNIHHFIKSTFD